MSLPPARPSVACEALERRALLSVTLDASRRALTVAGTEGPDVLYVAADKRLANVIVAGDGVVERRFSAGAARTLNLVGLGGDDRVIVDGSLAGLASWPTAHHYSHEHDFRLPTDGTRVWVHAGAGDDRVEAEGLGGIVILGDGDDVFDEAAGYGAPLSIHGGRGADRITVRGREHRAAGDKGDDVIAAAGANVLTGTFLGGDGADVLDARGTRAVGLGGGPGDDVLHAGVLTAGYGEAGRDWWTPDAQWRGGDWSAETEQNAGLPPGTERPAIGYDEARTHAPLLIPLDGVGYAVVDELRTTDGRAPGRPALLHDLSGDETPALTTRERRAVRPGVVVVPAHLKIEQIGTLNGGRLVWYRTTTTREFQWAGVYSAPEAPRVRMLCVPRGTVLARAAVPDEDAMRGALRWSNPARTRALAVPSNHVVGIVGQQGTWRTPLEDAPVAGAASPRGSRALLVVGGVMWLRETGAAFEAK